MREYRVPVWMSRGAIVVAVVAISSLALGRSGPGITERLKLPGLEENGGLGRDIAMNGNLIVVADDDTGSIGTLRLFEADGSGGFTRSVLTPTYGDAAVLPGQYGLATDGNTIVHGAPWTDGDRDEPGQAPPYNVGVLHVYVPDAGGAYSNSVQVRAPDVQEFDEFGYYVDVHDGAIVSGLHGREDEDAVALLLEPDGGGGYDFTELVPPGRDDESVRFGRSFGDAVAISSDVIVVTAPRYRDFSMPPAPEGAIFVFERGDPGGSEPVRILAPPEVGVGSSGRRFGRDVAVSGSAFAVSSTSFSPDSGNTPVPGVVYVFTPDEDGGWNQTRLVSPNPNGGDDFGRSIAMRGAALVVGAPRTTVGVQRSGVSYLFTPDGSGGFKCEKTLYASGARVTGAPLGARFPRVGASVAVSGFGIGVGAYGVDDGDGAVYLYGLPTFERLTLPPPTPPPGFVIPVIVQPGPGPGMRMSLDMDFGEQDVDLSKPSQITYDGFTTDIPGFRPNKSRTTWSYESADGLVTAKIKVTRGGKTSRGRMAFERKLGPSDTGPFEEPFGERSIRFTNGTFSVETTYRSVTDVQSGEAIVTVTGPPLSLDRVTAKVRGKRGPRIAMEGRFSGDGTVPADAPTVTLRFGVPGALHEAMIPGPDHVATKTANGWVFTLPDPDGKGGERPQGVTHVEVDYVNRKVTVESEGVSFGEFEKGTTPFIFAFGDGTSENAVQVQAKSGRSLKYK